MNASTGYLNAHDCQSDSIESAIVAVTAGRQWHLPVCLDLVIREIGASVSYTSCADAFTRFWPGRPVIHIDTAVSNARGRFIVAHELAHIMLRSPEALRIITKRGQESLLENEEKLANLVAGALLFPDDWLNAIRNVPHTFAGLDEIARRAGIPLSMLIRRMESSGIDIAFLHWRRGKHSWRIVDRPGTPPFLHGLVEISALSRKSLDHLGCEESELTIDCRVSGNWTRIRGIGYRFGDRGEHVMQFLSPQRDIAFADEDIARHS